MESPSIFRNDRSVSNKVAPAGIAAVASRETTAEDTRPVLIDIVASTPVSRNQMLRADCMRTAAIGDPAGPAVASPQRNRSSDNEDYSDDDPDVEEVRKACEYAGTIVQNFNARRHMLDPRAKRLVEGMNRKINAIVVKCDAPDVGNLRENINGRPTFKAELNRDKCDSSADEDSPPKRVRFAGRSRSSCPEDPVGLQGQGVRERSVPSRFPAHRDYLGTGSNSPVNLADVFQALARLDGRTVPKPEQYSGHGGQGLAQFLSSFEDYCTSNFKGSNSLWLGELARLLTGEIREVFDAVRVPGDSYEELKEKLLAWTRGQEEVLDRDAKSKFSGAVMKIGESVSRYGLRLESLFRVAYPGRSQQTSKTLQRKFRESVPSEFRTQLGTMQSVQKTLNQQELTWDAVKSVASQYDTSSRLEEANEAVWTTRQQAPISPPVRISEERRPRDYRTILRSPRNHSEPSRRRNYRDPAPAVEEEECDYCQRHGHTKRECRRYNRLCLLCGSPDHFIRACPRIRSELYDAVPYQEKRPLRKTQADFARQQHEATGSRMSNRRPARSFEPRHEPLIVRKPSGNE